MPRESPEPTGAPERPDDPALSGLEERARGELAAPLRDFLETAKEVTLPKHALGAMAKDTGIQNTLHEHDAGLLKQACSTEKGQVYKRAHGAFIQREIELDAALPDHMTRAQFMQFLDELEQEYREIVEPHVDNLGDEVATLVRNRDRAIMQGEREGAERMFTEAEKGMQPEVRIHFDEFEKLVDDAVAHVSDIQRIELEINRNLSSIANREWQEQGQALQKGIVNVRDTIRDHGSLNEEECLGFIGRMRNAKAAYNEHLAKCIKRSLIDDRRRLVGWEMDKLEKSCLVWFGRARREAERKESEAPAVVIPEGEVTIPREELLHLFDKVESEDPLRNTFRERVLETACNLSIDDPRRSEACRWNSALQLARERAMVHGLQPIEHFDEQIALSLVDVDEAHDEPLFAVCSSLLPASEVTQLRAVFKQRNATKRKAIRELFAKKRAEQKEKETPTPALVASEERRPERTVKKLVLAAALVQVQRPDPLPEQLFKAAPAAATQQWVTAIKRGKTGHERILDELPPDLTYGRCQRYLADLEGAFYPLKAAAEGFQPELRARAQEFVQDIYQACAEAVKRLFREQDAESPEKIQTLERRVFIEASEARGAIERAHAVLSEEDHRHVRLFFEGHGKQYVSARDAYYRRVERMLDISGAIDSKAAEGILQEFESANEEFIGALEGCGDPVVEEIQSLCARCLQQAKQEFDLAFRGMTRNSIPLKRADLTCIAETGIQYLRDRMETYAINEESTGAKAAVFHAAVPSFTNVIAAILELPEQTSDPQVMEHCGRSVRFAMGPLLKVLQQKIDDVDASNEILLRSSRMLSVMADKMIQTLSLPIFPKFGTLLRDDLSAIERIAQRTEIPAIPVDMQEICTAEEDRIRELRRFISELPGRITEFEPVHRCILQTSDHFQNHVEPLLQKAPAEVAADLRKSYRATNARITDVLLARYELKGMDQFREWLERESASELTGPLTRAHLEEDFERTAQEFLEIMEKHGVSAQSDGMQGSTYRLTQFCIGQGRELTRRLPETITEPGQMAKHHWEMYQIFDIATEATKAFEGGEAFHEVFSALRKLFLIAPSQEMLRHLEGTRSQEVLTNVDLQCLLAIVHVAHFFDVLEGKGEGVEELDKALQRLSPDEGRLSAKYPQIIRTHETVRQFVEEQWALFEKHIGPHLKNVELELAAFVREQHKKKYDSLLSVIQKHYTLEVEPIPHLTSARVAPEVASPTGVGSPKPVMMSKETLLQILERNMQEPLRDTQRRVDTLMSSTSKKGERFRQQAVEYAMKLNQLYADLPDALTEDQALDHLRAVTKLNQEMDDEVLEHIDPNLAEESRTLNQQYLATLRQEMDSWFTTERTRQQQRETRAELTAPHTPEDLLKLCEPAIDDLKYVMQVYGVTVNAPGEAEREAYTALSALLDNLEKTIHTFPAISRDYPNNAYTMTELSSSVTREMVECSKALSALGGERHDVIQEALVHLTCSITRAIVRDLEQPKAKRDRRVSREDLIRIFRLSCHAYPTVFEENTSVGRAITNYAHENETMLVQLPDTIEQESLLIDVHTRSSDHFRSIMEPCLRTIDPHEAATFRRNSYASWDAFFSVVHANYELRKEPALSRPSTVPREEPREKRTQISHDELIAFVGTVGVDDFVHTWGPRGKKQLSHGQVRTARAAVETFDEQWKQCLRRLPNPITRRVDAAAVATEMREAQREFNAAIAQLPPTPRDALRTAVGRLLEFETRIFERYELEGTGEEMVVEAPAVKKLPRRLLMEIYRRICGAHTLSNEDQEALFAALQKREGASCRAAYQTYVHEQQTLLAAPTSNLLAQLREAFKPLSEALRNLQDQELANRVCAIFEDSFSALEREITSFMQADGPATDAPPHQKT